MAVTPERPRVAAVSSPAGGLPLRGVRVVDFTWHGAGPYATKMLADYGADVIRIESTKRTDRLRLLPPFRDGVKGVNRSGYFADRNSNKRSMTLNLKHPGARRLGLDLIARADIVTNNFTPGTMDDLGLGYQAASAVRPDVIYLEMAMQGATGPDSDRVGYGQTVSALTGLHHLSGLPGRVPVGTGTNYPDHIAAPCHAAFIILAALRHRRRTGRGQYIDLAQTETMVSLLGPAVLDYTANGRVQQPRGNRADDLVQGVYRCRGEDRWIAISLAGDVDWAAAAAVLGGDLATDPRFRTHHERLDSHDDVDAAITARTAQRDARELMIALQEQGVAAGVVNDARDLIEGDPQLAAREHFAVLDHPEMGPSVYNAPPFRIAGLREEPMRHPAPLLGEHTVEVAREVLGLDDETIDRLIADDVLA